MNYVNSVLNAEFALPTSEGIDGVIDCLNITDTMQDTLTELLVLIREEVDNDDGDAAAVAMIDAAMALLFVRAPALHRALDIALLMRNPTKEEVERLMEEARERGRNWKPAPNAS